MVVGTNSVAAPAFHTKVLASTRSGDKAKPEPHAEFMHFYAYDAISVLGPF